MKSNVKKMIKEVLMEGLRRSNYNWEKTTLRQPRGGFFTNSEDTFRAYKNASMKLSIWQQQARERNPIIPPTLSEFERFLDINLAEGSFVEAQAMINGKLKIRSNSELIKEMREAIEDFRRLGCNDKVNIYEEILKQRIGEE